jgi:hypothetical protein
MSNHVYCEVLRKRARDLRDTDVIRHYGEWREVLSVYHGEEEAQRGLGLSDPPLPRETVLAEQVRDAFDRCADTYVILRLWVHEKSADQMEDMFVTVYRNELVEVQSLPACGPAPEIFTPQQAAKARDFIQAVASNVVVADDFTEGNTVFNEVVGDARRVAAELSITFEPGEVNE